MKDEYYTCPMHLEIQEAKPGRCPKCGMPLVLKSLVKDTGAKQDPSESLTSYTPLIVIIGMIMLVTILLALKDLQNGMFSLRVVMSNFMAGFFLVFSSVKLMDIKGFAQGYFTYDLLAKRVFVYGYIYPLIELLLGILYLLRYDSAWLSATTFAVMFFSGLGVLNSIRKKQRFQCACLGTLLKVPLTKVTLVEDFGMALMALTMLFMR